MNCWPNTIEVDNAELNTVCAAIGVPTYDAKYRGRFYGFHEPDLVMAGIAHVAVTDATTYRVHCVYILYPWQGMVRGYRVRFDAAEKAAEILTQGAYV